MFRSVSIPHKTKLDRVAIEEFLDDLQAFCPQPDSKLMWRFYDESVAYRTDTVGTVFQAAEVRLARVFEHGSSL